jgi:hypothetical protein
LASKSLDNTIRLWRCDTWTVVAEIEEPAANFWPQGIAFHPHLPVLATLGDEDTAVRLWDLDIDALLGVAPATPSVHYSNAKVVLVGNNTVGKTGLSLVLADQRYRETDSTHGRNVLVLDSAEVGLPGGNIEARETLLWDLAGQPGYRLVHQLHLDEVAVALVVFDAGAGTGDPFEGVLHWDRALQTAQVVQGDAAPPLTKFLVHARVDRGRVRESRARMEAMADELGYAGYFETSAKEGWGIDELATAVRAAVDWSALPKVSSPELFQPIKAFLIQEKEQGRLLSTADELYRGFLRSPAAPAPSDELRASFDTCVLLLESRGLIRRLSFGDFVLLQPELLDAYASKLVNAVNFEDEGLGTIPVEDVIAGRFPMPETERIADRGQEKVLLLATVEDMLRHEIALREDSEHGAYLLFPSQLTRERPQQDEQDDTAVTFTFQGPLLNVYSTLAVRLAHSGLFTQREMWKNAALYTASAGGACGIRLAELKGGHGELALFFDSDVGEETRFYFEEYVHTHLRRRALPESIVRRRVFRCADPDCGTRVTDEQAERRRARGFDSIQCPVCEQPVSLLERPDSGTRAAAVTSGMDTSAASQLQRDAAAATLRAKIETGDFDVFLAHSGADKDLVRPIGEWLKERGILPWLDEWEVPPFVSWQDELQKAIPRMKAAAVFVGPSGVGPWQDIEIKAFLSEFAKRKLRMGLVLLPGCPEKPEVPLFMKIFNRVDFRKDTPDPWGQLVWGITGERPG